LRESIGDDYVGGSMESAADEVAGYWSPNGLDPDSLRRMTHDRFLEMAKALEARGRLHETAVLFREFAAELDEELHSAGAGSGAR
jgi:hypothetical protein